jgi:hypothetical protein
MGLLIFLQDMAITNRARLKKRGKQIQGCGWEQLQGLSLPIVRNIIGTGAFKHLFSF